MNGADSDTARLPAQLRDRLLHEAAQDLSVPKGQVQIQGAWRRTWPNGCLGLPQPEEFCSMALVEGWLAEVIGGEETAAYRIDATGLQVRRDRQP